MSGEKIFWQYSGRTFIRRGGSGSKWIIPAHHQGTAELIPMLASEAMQQADRLREMIDAVRPVKRRKK